MDGNYVSVDGITNPMYGTKYFHNMLNTALRLKQRREMGVGQFMFGVLQQYTIPVVQHCLQFSKGLIVQYKPALVKLLRYLVFLLLYIELAGSSIKCQAVAGR